MGIEQSQAPDVQYSNDFAVKCLKSRRQWHFRRAHDSYSRFPLTCESPFLDTTRFQPVESRGRRKLLESDHDARLDGLNARIQISKG